MEQFNDFLNEVDAKHKNFAQELHDIFSRENCKVKIEKKATGIFVFYASAKTKKSIFNFLIFIVNF